MSDWSENKNSHASLKLNRRIMRSRRRILQSPMLNEIPAQGYLLAVPSGPGALLFHWATE